MNVQMNVCNTKSAPVKKPTDDDVMTAYWDEIRTVSPAEYTTFVLKKQKALKCDTGYLALGLTGEAGEVAELLKKTWRRKGSLQGCMVDDTQFRAHLVSELGDVLWYVTALAGQAGFDLDDLMTHNHLKLKLREEAGINPSKTGKHIK